MTKRQHHTEQGSRSEAWATLALLCLVIAVPLGATLGQQVGEGVSATENRRLAQPPALPTTAASLADYPKALERYWDDHLGLRDSMIRAWAWLHVVALGTSSSESLVVGREGWLFFGDRRAVDQARGLAPLSEQKLVRWQHNVEAWRDWLHARDIAYLLVLVPNKHDIYREHLPKALSIVSDEEPLGQLARHLRKHSDVPFVNLRTPLAAEKSRRSVYHKTDTHWNDTGALLAAQTVLSAARALIPELVDSPIPVEALRYRGDGLGLAQIVGLAETLREDRLDWIPANARAELAPAFRKDFARREREQRPFAMRVPGSLAPTAVVFRDSFANALIPYLSERFARTLYVWSPDPSIEFIEREQPDIVIHEVVARFYQRVPKAPEGP